MTGKGSDSFTYDYEDKLTDINATNHSSFKYDGEGNRVELTSDGITTRYVLDVNNELSQVLVETDSLGNITSYYVYGIGLISRISPSGNVSYYHHIITITILATRFHLQIRQRISLINMPTILLELS
jgi:YD repeat-containing protein